MFEDICCDMNNILSRGTKNTTTGRTELLRLIQQGQWDAATIRARSLPLEVSEWYVEKYEMESCNAVPLASSGSDNAMVAGHMLMERLLPLHLACEMNAPFDVVRTLLEVYPEAAMMREYGQGCTPLVLACASPPTAQQNSGALQPMAGRPSKTKENSAQSQQANTISLLLSYYPRSILTANNLGQLPIHVACAGNLGVEVVRVLLDAWKIEIDSIRQDHENGRLQQNSLQHQNKVTSSGNWGCLEQKDKDGNIPLHLLCAIDTINLDTLSLLLSRAPHTVTLRNYAGKTAADIVDAGWCGNKMGVLALLKKDTIYWRLNYQQAYGYGVSPQNFAEETNDEEDVELNSKSDLLKYIERFDLASKDKSIEQSVVHFLKSHPEESKIFYCMKDGDGTTWRRFLPLHLALEKKLGFQCVLSLLNAYPESIKKQDQNGQLPLHIACENSVSYEIFAELFRRNKDAVTEVDSWGMTCLHLACWGHGSDNLKIVKDLVKTYPDALGIYDNYERTPLNIAQSQCNDELVDFLQEHEVPQQKDEVMKASIVKRSLIDLIENKMWFDVITQYGNSNFSSHILNEMLKQRPPFTVIKNCMDSGKELTLDEFNLAVDVADKFGCNNEIIIFLKAQKKKMFPQEHLSVRDEDIAYVDDNNDDDFVVIDDVVVLNDDEDNEYDRSDSSEEECDEEISEDFLMGGQSIIPEKICDVPTIQEDTPLDDVIDEPILIRTKSDDGETVNSFSIQYRYSHKNKGAAPTPIPILKLQSTDSTVFVPYAQPLVESSTLEYGDLQEKISILSQDESDPQSLASKKGSSAVVSEDEDSVHQVEDDGNEVIPPASPRHTSSSLDITDPHTCSSTSTELRSNAAVPSINFLSDDEEDKTSQPGRSTKTEESYSDSIQNFIHQSEQVMALNRAGAEDEGIANIDDAHNVYEEIERRLANRDRILTDQLLDSALSRSTSESSRSLLQEDRRDSLSDRSIDQFYKERERRLSISADSVIKGQDAESANTTDSLQGSDKVVSNVFTNNENLADDESSSSPNLSIREQTLKNFGLYASVNESYAAMFQQIEKSSNLEVQSTSKVSPTRTREQLTMETSQSRISNNRLPPLPEEYENNLKREGAFNLYMSSTVLGFSIVLGSLLGLLLSYALRKYRILVIFAFGAKLSLSVGDVDQESKGALSVILKYFKRVCENTSDCPIVENLRCATRRNYRKPFPPREQSQKENAIIMLQSILAMSLLGAAFFGLISSGWALVGASLFASSTLLDDEWGDLARCMGKFTHVMIIELIYSLGEIVILYEHWGTVVVINLEKVVRNNFRQQQPMNLQSNDMNVELIN